MRDTKHFTILGGMRLFWQALGTVGYRDFGDITSVSLLRSTETKELKSSRSGSLKTLKKGVTGQTRGVKFAVRELDGTNMSHSMGAGGVSERVAAGNMQIVDEMLVLTGSNPVALALPLATGAAPVITSLPAEDGTRTAYAVGDDYTAIGQAFARVDDGDIADGEAVLVTYMAAMPARDVIAVGTLPIGAGSARFVMQPDEGTQALWVIDSAEITEDGDFDAGDEDYASSGLQLECLDNSDSTPGLPFGKLHVWNKAA